MRSFLLVLLVCFSFVMAKGQNPVVKPIDSSKQQLDTLPGEPAYVNKGKIAGRKAFTRSLMFPGLGQIYNYGLIVDDVKNGLTTKKQGFNKVYTLAKLAGVYTAGTLLALAYIDNNRSYKLFLNELQYRRLNNNMPNPENGLDIYTDANQLTIAKNIFKRNREVVLISFVGLYGIAALEAYVSARLRYFNVDETLTFKIAPSTINTTTMYGFNAAPALKLTLKL